MKETPRWYIANILMYQSTEFDTYLNRRIEKSTGKPITTTENSIKIINLISTRELYM